MSVVPKGVHTAGSEWRSDPITIIKRRTGQPDELNGDFMLPTGWVILPPSRLGSIRNRPKGRSVKLKGGIDLKEGL